jgi:peptide/nickel transport system permease protein
VMRFIVGRLLQSVFVVIGVTLVTFALVFLGGDPVYVYADERASAEEVAQLRRELGLDRPWIVQYLDFLTGLARGDLGRSLRYHAPVADLILERLPATLQLAAAALAIAIFVPIPLAIVAARNRGKWPDSLAMTLVLIGQSLPNFWLGVLLIMLFGVHLRWFPISGSGTFMHLVLPAITLSTFSTARNARLLRSSFLEVLSLDYIRTARSKGANEHRIFYGHALKNALLASVTVVGLEIGFLLGGSVIVETVFAWPGMGRLTIQAIYGKDLPLVQGAVTFLALVFVVVNLLVDLAYTFLDPRVRYE